MRAAPTIGRVALPVYPFSCSPSAALAGQEEGKVPGSKPEISSPTKERGGPSRLRSRFVSFAAVAPFLSMALALSWANRARAEDGPLGLGGTGLEAHGFVSQGYIRTTDNNYLAKSDHGSFEFAEAGLNFTESLTEKMRAGIQLFARDLGPVGNYSVKADWFYLDYRFADWLGVRAGRTKLPFGLYNDISDVDSARVSVLLPQSVYPTGNRDYLLAQTGVEVYGRLPTGPAGTLDYRLYAGTIYVDSTTPKGSPIVIQSLTVPYLYGGRVLWETPLEGLRFGGSAQALRLDTTLLQDTNQIIAKIPVTLWVASIEYAFGNLQLATEYGRWHVRTSSSAPDLIPRTAVDNERAYVLAAYRLSDWFEPGAYYSAFFPNSKQHTGTAAQEHDVALSLRFDINAHWLFKLEGHYMLGTADLNSSLNDNRPLSDLTRQWGAFFAKTTAYF